MTSPSLTQSIASTPPVITDRQILFHLIRQEWRLCRGLVIPLSMIWVIGLWVLVIFSHPAWLLVLGLLHVMLISPNQAGRDIMDGTEEFSFALPSGRSPLYLARLAPGLVFLLANGLLGSLAIACNLPQCVWAMAFSGGLTEPFAPVTGAHWYAMVLQHRSMLASDANQPASVRMLAMNAMKQGTFFHSATADARIRAIADDPATPPSLRTFAASLERS